MSSKRPSSAARIVAMVASLWSPLLPITVPIVGTTISAIRSDADRVNNKVSGRNIIKSPVVPGQNNKGKNTARVVAVDAIMGHAIRLAASL